MNTVELFCGTKSFSNFFSKKGFKTYTVDFDKSFEPDLVCDLLKELPKELKEKIKKANIIWMSPPCTTFSMASGNTHWNVDRTPKTKQGIEAKKLLLLCKKISEYCDKNNKIYFIENPRARARWFLPDDSTRHTVWYCQYGDIRAKPTDIWTNLDNWVGKKCFNGNPNCHHERAPRGSKSGTQGLKNSKEMGKIPIELFKELYNKVNELYKKEVLK